MVYVHFHLRSRRLFSLFSAIWALYSWINFGISRILASISAILKGFSRCRLCPFMRLGYGITVGSSAISPNLIAFFMTLDCTLRESLGDKVLLGPIFCLWNRIFGCLAIHSLTEFEALSAIVLMGVLRRERAAGHGAAGEEASRHIVKESRKVLV